MEKNVVLYVFVELTFRVGAKRVAISGGGGVFILFWINSEIYLVAFDIVHLFQTDFFKAKNQ